MRCIPVLRGIAVLAALLLGACDATRSTSVVEPTARPRANSLPAPSTISVTNSGGYPLVSWNAVSGAIEYTVTLKFTEFAVDQYGQEWYQGIGYGSSPVTTTGTSVTDYNQLYSGDYRCSTNYGYYGPMARYYSYEIVTTFSNGTSTTHVLAPVAKYGCW